MVNVGTKFDDRYFVLAFELAAQGHPDKDIAAGLGVADATFRKWLRRRPAFRDAVERGRGNSGCGKTFSDYVCDRLPPDLARAWNGILALEDDAEDNPRRQAKLPERIEEFFANDASQARRMSLWFHAYVTTNFNARAACRLTNVGVSTLAEWEKKPQFQRLKAAVPRLMRDFADSAFWRGVMAGETNLILAAQKAHQPELYNKPKQIEHSGQVSQLNAHVNVTDVVTNMPLEDRKRLLEAMRAKQLPAHKEDVA